MKPDNREEAAWAERDQYLEANVKLVAEIKQLREWKANTEQAFLDVLDAINANSTTAPVKEFIRAKLGLPAGGQMTQQPDNRARPLSEWHEDMGPVLWWRFPINEPYVGTPNDLGHTVEVTVRAFGVDKLMRVNVGGWPGYHTHWTPIPVPVGTRYDELAMQQAPKAIRCSRCQVVRTTPITECGWSLCPHLHVQETRQGGK